MRICDRCGEAIEWNKVGFRLYLPNPDEHYCIADTDEYELCPDCARAVAAYIKGVADK